VSDEKDENERDRKVKVNLAIVIGSFANMFVGVALSPIFIKSFTPFSAALIISMWTIGSMSMMFIFALIDTLRQQVDDKQFERKMMESYREDYHDAQTRSMWFYRNLRQAAEGECRDPKWSTEFVRCLDREDGEYCLPCYAKLLVKKCGIKIHV
jgi:hypothetical protein